MLTSLLAKLNPASRQCFCSIGQHECFAWLQELTLYWLSFTNILISVILSSQQGTHTKFKLLSFNYQMTATEVLFLVVQNDVCLLLWSALGMWWCADQSHYSFKLTFWTCFEHVVNVECLNWRVRMKPLSQLQHTKNCISQEGVKTENNEHINLKVAGQDGSVVQFKIKRHTPLSKLMKAYCERQVSVLGFYPNAQPN